MEYKEKLKTKEWRNRRRQILVRDNFKCQRCGHRSIHNDVHHVVYEWGCEPWEYNDEYLITLCRSCHNEEHKDSKHISEVIKSMKLSGMFCHEIKSKMNINFGN